MDEVQKVTMHNKSYIAEKSWNGLWMQLMIPKKLQGK